MAPSAHIDMPPVPLALSFFTFQQIGYLLIPPRRDGCGEGDRRTRFRDYALFIAFFITTASIALVRAVSGSPTP